MRHLYQKASLAVLSLALAFTSWAQEPCGQDHLHRHLMATDPEAAIRMRQTEREVDQYVQDVTEGRKSTNNSTYVIPVVFHIVHNNGPENVSSARVLESLEILNADFNRRNADLNQVETAFTNIIGDVSVEFRLATRDPQGNCTDGITRTVFAQTNAANDNVKAANVRPAWDPTRYLNIWVVGDISLSGISGVVGFAYLPSTISQNLEGVVVVASSIGNQSAIFNLDRTLSHEVGHYMGLLHTWGNGQVGAGCTGSDLVNDTPVTNGRLGGCPRPYRPCSNTQANIQNIMDYSDCSLMFTAGQATRMQGFLNSNTSNRRNHWQPANLASTGTTVSTGTTLNLCAPVVSITSGPILYACANNNVSLNANVTNLSSTTGTNFTWTVPGAVTPTATGASASFRFAAPGVYSATVIATNNIGSDTAELTNFINVYPDTAGFRNGYTEPFANMTTWPASGSNLGNSWRLENSTTSTWRLATDVGNRTPNSLTINNRIAIGSINSAISPTVDITGLTTPRFLSYDWAYAPRSTANSDELKVYQSIDCGNTWTLLVTRNLTTTPSLNTRNGGGATQLFIPDTIDFRNENIRLNIAGTNGRRVQFKFEMRAGGGNPTWIDNVRVYGFVTSTASSLRQFVTLFPNPVGAGSPAKLQISDLGGQTATVQITDALGRTVNTQSYDLVEQLETLTLPTLSSGMYYVTVRSGASSTVQKLVVQ